MISLTRTREEFNEVINENKITDKHFEHRNPVLQEICVCFLPKTERITTSSQSVEQAVDFRRLLNGNEVTLNQMKTSLRRRDIEAD
jgi:hypothetical protein